MVLTRVTELRLQSIAEEYVIESCKDDGHEEISRWQYYLQVPQQ